MDAAFGTGIIDKYDDDIGTSNSLIDDLQQNMRMIRGESKENPNTLDKDFKLSDVSINID